jgi:predicted RNA-binding Zn-ribbon protein involved in translation (DUF1610 family)
MRKTEIRMESDAKRLPAPDTPFEKEEIYTIDVVGESFENDDGTSRQEIIKNYVKKGAIVDLEFYLYEGSPACRVMIGSKQIGHLPAWFAPKLFDHVKRGGFAKVSVNSVGKSEESGLYGVSLLIDQYIPQKAKDKMQMLPCPTCGHHISKSAALCPNCGEVLKEQDNTEKKETFIDINKKSRTTSFILTLLFGPLGLLYSSVVASIILIVLAVATSPTGVGPVVVWVLSIALGDHFTYNHNKKIKKQAEIIA